MSSQRPGPQISPPARPPDAGAKPRKPDSTAPDGGPALQGEGNVTAARRYNEATEDFVASGQVAQKAREAAPKTPQEGDALQRAEAEGKRHAKR